MTSFVDENHSLVAVHEARIMFGPSCLWIRGVYLSWLSIDSRGYLSSLAVSGLAGLIYSGCLSVDS